MRHRILGGFGRGVVFTLCLAALAGCAAGRADGGPQGPEWVRDGSGAVVAGRRKVFRGVGVARPGLDGEAARASARTRGKNELERVLVAYMSLFRAEFDAGRGRGPDRSAEAARFLLVVKRFSQICMTDAEQAAYWHGLDEDKTYALVQLELSAVVRRMRQTPAFDAFGPEILTRIVNGADRAFDEMASERYRRP